MEQLERRFSEMVTLCEQFNARAYIRLSRRDARVIAKELLILLGDAFRNDSYQHLRKIYSTAVGRNKGLDKIRIIDRDENTNVFDVITLLTELKPLGKKIIAELDTKNWKHIITNPFDLKTFKEKFPNLDVHKNNPTCLFIP